MQMPSDRRGRSSVGMTKHISLSNLHVWLKRFSTQIPQDAGPGNSLAFVVPISASTPTDEYPMCSGVVTGKVMSAIPHQNQQKNQTTWLAQSEKFIVGNWQLLCHANRLRLTPEPGLLSPDQVCDEAKDSGKHGWPAAERCCHVVCLIVHLPHAL